MSKYFFPIAVLFAMTAVILGAFAAHGLKHKLSEPLLSAFQTGVQYQFYHALGLLLVVLLHKQFEQALMLWAGWFFVAGMLLFSGSLYMLALSGYKWFGPITPIGGVCFIVGWCFLLVASLRSV